MANTERQIQKTEEESRVNVAEIEQLESKKDDLRQDYFNCYLEYNSLVARKYKLMSKSKQQARQRAAQQHGDDGAIEDLKEQLLDHVKSKANFEQLIKQLNENGVRLRGEVADLIGDTTAASADGRESQANQSEVAQLQIRILRLSSTLEALGKFFVELSGLQSFMEKNMLSGSKRQEISLALDRIEREQFAVSDKLKSKDLKLREVVKATAAMPMHDQVLEKLTRCKRLRQAVEDGDKEIRALKESASKLTSLQVTLREQEAKYQSKSSEYNMLQGQDFMLRQTQKEYRIEQGKQCYANIEQAILDINVKYCLTKDIALEVSEKMDALEESLMRYHHEKMKEINSTLADFWRLTYKGNDIETIEIKSDVEKTAANQRVKSYNYRIVLKTHDDTELDMKGRCSAGQKVLASFIIRLSLAETFCANCGILALDEPTTNLDQENIEGLANALKDIIESRKKQDSFQLIVITHDDMFVQCLGADFTEHVWKISKDSNSYSRITKQSLNQMLN